MKRSRTSSLWTRLQDSRSGESSVRATTWSTLTYGKTSCGLSCHIRIQKDSLLRSERKAALGNNPPGDFGSPYSFSDDGLLYVTTGYPTDPISPVCNTARCKRRYYEGRETSNDSLHGALPKAVYRSFISGLQGSITA
jgi:hypothetical protein